MAYLFISLLFMDWFICLLFLSLLFGVRWTGRSNLQLRPEALHQNVLGEGRSQE